MRKCSVLSRLSTVAAQRQVSAVQQLPMWLCSFQRQTNLRLEGCVRELAKTMVPEPRVGRAFGVRRS